MSALLPFTTLFIYSSQTQFLLKLSLWDIYLRSKYLQQDAAATAGEISFKSFMIAVQRCASSVAILQQVICTY
jgi:hypothetical protein